MNINTFLVTSKSTFLRRFSLVAVLCVISSNSSLHAQVQGSQASTLLEVQALRQEVAQLRDMVERQQYELRKIKRSLQDNKAPVVTSPLSTVPSANSVSTSLVQTTESDVQLGNNNNGSPISTNSVVNAQANAIDASAELVDPVSVNSQIRSVNELNQVEAVAQSAAEKIATTSKRSVPQVVDVAIGNSVATQQQTASSLIDSSGSIVLSDGDVTTQPVIINTQTAQSLESNVRETAAGVSSLSLIDIKPVETIKSGSIVSVPGSVATQETSPATALLETVQTSQSLNVISENDYYQQAFNLLKESKHAEAVQVFQQQIKSYPRGDRADDAYYWIAESMYVKRKLNISKENFKAIVQGYPNSERLPDAMLKLAYIEQEQGNIIEARILLQEIMQFHPKSDAALLAKNRLSEVN